MSSKMEIVENMVYNSLKKVGKLNEKGYVAYTLESMDNVYLIATCLGNNTGDLQEGNYIWLASGLKAIREADPSYEYAWIPFEKNGMQFAYAFAKIGSSKKFGKKWEEFHIDFLAQKYGIEIVDADHEEDDELEVAV